MHFQVFTLTLACSLGLTALASGQEAAPAPTRSVVRPTLPFKVTDAVCRHDLVIVKFREGIRVRQIDGVLVSLDGQDLTSVLTILGQTRVSRLFTRPVEILDQERAELQGNLPANAPALADLNNYYQVSTSGAVETEDLVNRLNLDPLIETAYAEFVPIALNGGDIAPVTSNFEAQQTYLDSAPNGLGYRPLQSIVGARFPDNKMAQLEGGWNLGHEDCCWLAAANYLGAPPSGGYSTALWTDHGTACVGIMAASRNAYGVRGFGSDCQAFYLVSLTNGSANMVNITAAQMSAGDVMSSSFAFGLSVGSSLVHAPRDFPQADYDAVASAAAKGIHYTFGAGNTGWDLQNPSPFGTRYASTAASSGGYIIGATDPGAAGRASWSNYGMVHVIANAWGSGVTTLGYGDLFNPNDIKQHYTATFSGTSAAGPQIAGVIAALVGAVKEQTGQVLTVAQVKAALQTTGTPVTGDVGNRSDLAALLALFGLPDGLLVTQDGTIGGTFTYQVTGNTGEPWAVLIAGGRGNFNLGVNRPILVDLTTAAQLGAGVLAGSSQSLAFNVPNDPSMVGANLYLQGGLIRQGNLHLTNSAALAIQ